MLVSEVPEGEQFRISHRGSTGDPALATEDPYERLGRLKGLLDAGAISQEEFDREKQEVLDR